MTKKWVNIPDLGGIDEVTVLEVLIKPGDVLSHDQPICTLESDKASMEVPASSAGKVMQVALTVGQKVNEGMPAYEVETEEVIAAASEEVVVDSAPVQTVPKTVAEQQVRKQDMSDSSIYAGPSVRRLAHALDIPLDKVQGSGPKGRVLRDDLYAYIKKAMHSSAPSPSMPLGDPYKYGTVEQRPLSKIKQATAEHMRRCWSLIPHVTQHDRVDITELENFRQLCKPVLSEQGIRLTMLAFIFKALVEVMQEHPYMNASFDENNKTLLIKKYFHIGVAVDTPGGLMVPVLKDVDQLSVSEIAKGLQTISERARDGSITPAELQGGSFTVTSLGGIGGDYFTPIVNGPQVAILGVSKAQLQPIWHEDAFVPRLMLPLSLSYDHRVVDGAEAARFMVALADRLTRMQEQTLTLGLQSG